MIQSTGAIAARRVGNFLRRYSLNRLFWALFLVCVYVCVCVCVCVRARAHVCVRMQCQIYCKYQEKRKSDGIDGIAWKNRIENKNSEINRWKLFLSAKSFCGREEFPGNAERRTGTWRNLRRDRNVRKVAARVCARRLHLPPCGIASESQGCKPEGSLGFYGEDRKRTHGGMEEP